MKLREFTENSAITAIYPNRGALGGLVYVTYGLCGEIGEVLEIIKKVLRDDGSLFTPEKIERAKSEVGDVLWYWSQMVFESNTNVEIELESDALQEQIYEAFLKTNEVDITSFDFAFLQGKLISSCYIYGAKILDTLNSLASTGEIEKNLPIISQLNTEIFKTLCVFLSNMGIKVSDVMQMNLDKLSARKEAGKIKGSGENLDER